MLKGIAAAAVLTLTVAPALASDVGRDARNELPPTTVTGPIKQAERNQTPRSEGMASAQRAPDKQPERMACTCHGTEKHWPTTTPAR